MLEEVFDGNKKIIKLFLIIYILISIIILIFIWVPFNEKVPSFAIYNKYTEKDIISKVSERYINEITFQFMLGEKESISKNINVGYVNYRALTKEQIIQELEELNLFDINTTFGQVIAKGDGNVYTYTFDIINGSNKRKVNVIETKPYEYTLSFDNFVGYKKSNLVYTEEKIKFNLEEIYKDEYYIEFTMGITNLENDYIIFNTATSTDVYAVLSDGTKYNLVNPTNTDNGKKILKAGLIRRKFNFEIPFSIQSKVSKIVFSNVNVNSDIREIVIEL